MLRPMLILRGPLNVMSPWPPEIQEADQDHEYCLGVHHVAVIHFGILLVDLCLFAELICEDDMLRFPAREHAGRS